MVKLIVAISANYAIGKDNDLIWHLPADMRFFSETTKGNIVLMGRKNWTSIPDKYRPLPGRLNLVVTHDTTFSDEGCEIFHDIETALAKYESDDRDLYVIGGGQVYKYCLDNDLIDQMIITHIEAEFEADTFFPEIIEDKWNIETIREFKKDTSNPYDFFINKYTKVSLK